MMDQKRTPLKPEPHEPRQAAIVFILFTVFIDILAIGVVVPVLPELVKELLVKESPELIAAEMAADPEIDSFKTATYVVATRYAGVIAASYALMQFLFAPIMGTLSDRFGRRPIILISLLGLGVDFIIQGLASNIGWLFVGRVLAGIMGANFTTAIAYIADVSTEDTRARNFGFMGMMFGLGFTIGPSLGGLLGAYHLRAPFFLAASLALINWLYGYFILPESLPKENRNPFTLRNANPLSSLIRLRAYPLVAGLALVFMCKSLTQRGLENVWVLYTGYRYQWDEITNGIALGLVGICAIIVQGGLVRPVVKRFGERKTVIFGCIVGTLGFLGYALASEGWMVYVVITTTSLGGLAGPAIQSLVTSTVDENEQGKIQGSLTSLTSLTNIIAPLFFNSLLFSFFISDASPIHLPGAPFFVASVILVIATVIAYFVFKRFPQSYASAEK